MSTGAKSRVAVVTGGGVGIGAAICARLAADGHDVVVNYSKSEAQATEVVGAISSTGRRAVKIKADVSDPDQVAAMFAEAADRLGHPAVVVNNAGYSGLGRAGVQSPAEWGHVVDLNLKAAYYCVHAALPGMLAAGFGRIVLVTSPAAERVPLMMSSAYAAAKAGLNAMTRAIAKELAERDITINAVMPGFVETNMTREAGEDAIAHMRKSWTSIPTEAVAATVAFLVGPDATYISGEEIGVWKGGPAVRVTRVER